MRKLISALANKGIQCKLVVHPVDGNSIVLPFGNGSLGVCNNRSASDMCKLSFSDGAGTEKCEMHSTIATEKV